MATAPSDDLFPNVRNREGTLVINDRCVVTPEGARAAIQALHGKPQFAFAHALGP